MAQPVRGFSVPWPQQGGAEELESNSSVPQAKGGKVIADYDPDVDYNPEGSDPDVEAVNEEEKNFDAEYAKMKLP